MKKLGLVLAVLFGAAPADAQPRTPTPSDPPPPTSTLTSPSAPPPASDPNAGVTAQAQQQPPKETKKEPGRGDFDAGGQVRLPSGPDEEGKYAAFNWIALDGKARY